MEQARQDQAKGHIEDEAACPMDLSVASRPDEGTNIKEDRYQQREKAWQTNKGPNRHARQTPIRDEAGGKEKRHRKHSNQSRD